MEESVGLSEKDTSGARMVMATGPLLRRVDVVVGAS